jgi:hypothetical protein
MAPKKGTISLADLAGDRASDTEEFDLPTPDSAAENRRIAQTKGRGKQKAVSNTRSVATKKATTKSVGRAVLSEKNNINNVANEEDEEDDDLNADTATAHKRTAKPGRKPKTARNEDLGKESEMAPKKAGRGRPKANVKTTSKRAGSPEHNIPETQAEPEGEPEPMDVEHSIEVDEIPDTQPDPARDSSMQQNHPLSAQPSSRVRHGSLQPQVSSRAYTSHRRAGSVSDSERTNDPMLRRKLGDMTKQLESMTMKYNNLRSAAVTDSTSNFEKLKKSTEQREKGML